jgi:hypothetical protein
VSAEVRDLRAQVVRYESRERMLGDLHESLIHCISRAGSAWEAGRKAARERQHLAFGDALAELDDALSTIATMRSILEHDAAAESPSDEDAPKTGADEGTLARWFAELVDDIAEVPVRRRGRTATPDRRRG